MRTGYCVRSNLDVGRDGVSVMKEVSDMKDVGVMKGVSFMKDRVMQVIFSRFALEHRTYHTFHNSNNSNPHNKHNNIPHAQ